MKKVRLWIVKMIRSLLVKLGRGGSLPGNIALKLDSSILSKFKMPSIVVVVTGTNGKTTTSNIIYETLCASGLKVISNRKGDNLREGITTLLCANSNYQYEIMADAVVLEIDELTIPRVFDSLSVSCFVVLDFFRDQLDRAGEMETIVRKVESVLPTFQGDLILNGNDPNVVRLADSAEHAKVSFFGAERSVSAVQVSSEASEGKFCPRCGKSLSYDYYQYSHIGAFNCSCGFGKNDFLVLAKVSDDFNSFEVNNVQYHAFQSTIYSIYNSCAVLCVLLVNDIDLKYAGLVFDSFSFKEGRNESFDIGIECSLNLVKNPTGANEVMKFIVSDSSDKNILIILNDKDQDGRDVSWIWDAHFDLLLDDHSKLIICSGLRAYDMALRLKYEGCNAELEVIEDIESAITKLQSSGNKAYVVSTYTALFQARNILRKRSCK